MFMEQKITNTTLNSENIIDLVLSKTQRKTPTIIHQHFSIQKIRRFYIKKLKFVCEEFSNYIYNTLRFFPFVNQTNPFFKDLFNLLFNKNYYKIALGQLKTSIALISKISKVYIKLLKSGSSLYSCKSLKKKAIGKICSLLKKLKCTFRYLEKIRVQINFIPLVDFYKKTVLLCGSLSCGKTSLMGKLTKINKTKLCNFSTKFLYVGHFNNNFINWQLLDTPGLDSISEKKYNLFEMQTIGAFVHLDNIPFYLFDFSNQNRTSILKQIDILNSVLFFFKKKKLFFLLNKTDLNWEKTKNKIKKSIISYVFNIFFEKKQFLKISSHDEVGLIVIKYKLHIIKEHVMILPNIYGTFVSQSTKAIKNSIDYQNTHSIDLKRKNYTTISVKYLPHFYRKYNFTKNKSVEKREKIKEFSEEIGFIFQEFFYCF